MKTAAIHPPALPETAPAVVPSTFVHKLREFGAGFMCMLREIGDENGYERWRTEKGVAHSGESWRKYCDERFAAKMKNPKCC